MGRNCYTLSFETARCIGIVRTITTLTHLICLKSLCDEMFRSCEDNTYIIIIIVIYRSYLWSWTMPFIASKNDDILRRLWSSRKDNIVLKRLWFTSWISYYSGRKTTAIQLYLADLHCECRTEHSVLHWSLKLWDVISMWRTDLEMERCVQTMFCIQKNIAQKTVNESLRSWRATRLV